MLNPRLASRYAKSLIDISIEQNCLENTLKDMQLIDAICKQNPDFLSLMRSPVFKADKKNAIIDAILSSRVSALTIAFLKLLTNKGRERNIDEIAQAFMFQYRHNKNIRLIKLTTASPVEQAVVDTLKQKISAAYQGATVEVETAIDLSLLGGFVLDMGDKQMDASILRDLLDIKKQFTKNLYVSQI
jgi:F-type H+-transporting ATPase subunit delta